MTENAKSPAPPVLVETNTYILTLSRLALSGPVGQQHLQLLALGPACATPKGTKH